MADELAAQRALKNVNQRYQRNNVKRSWLHVRDAARARSIMLHRRSFQSPPKEKLTLGDRISPKTEVHAADRIERAKKASASSGSKKRSIGG